jgi:uncharacterized membrane protein
LAVDINDMVKITIRMAKLPVLAVSMVAGNVALYLLAPQRGKPPQLERLGRMLCTNMILIGLGIAVQFWDRDKPRYIFLKRIAYLWTLLLMMLVSFATMQVLLRRVFPR